MAPPAWLAGWARASRAATDAADAAALEEDDGDALTPTSGATAGVGAPGKAYLPASGLADVDGMERLAQPHCQCPFGVVYSHALPSALPVGYLRFGSKAIPVQLHMVARWTGAPDEAAEATGRACVDRCIAAARAAAATATALLAQRHRSPFTHSFDAKLRGSYRLPLPNPRPPAPPLMRAAVRALSLSLSLSLCTRARACVCACNGCALSLSLCVACA
jgi:hypothetical protein